MKDSLIHHPSSQGWAPGVQTFFVQVFCCLLYVLGWRDGGGRRVATYFFSILLYSYILGLVCYKHTIHAFHESYAVYTGPGPGSIII